MLNKTISNFSYYTDSLNIDDVRKDIKRTLQSVINKLFNEDTFNSNFCSNKRDFTSLLYSWLIDKLTVEWFKKNNVYMMFGQSIMEGTTNIMFFYGNNIRDPKNIVVNVIVDYLIYDEAKTNNNFDRNFNNLDFFMKNSVDIYYIGYLSQKFVDKISVRNDLDGRKINYYICQAE